MVNQLAGPPAIEEVPPAEESKVTEFVTRDGREYLTGGVVDLVYYNQGEEPWASQPSVMIRSAATAAGPRRWPCWPPA